MPAKEDPETEEQFVPLLQPRDATERELAKNLLDSAGIRNTLVDSDRLDVLQVLGGEQVDGMQLLVVPEVDFERSLDLLREAWGEEALAGRIPGRKMP